MRVGIGLVIVCALFFFGGPVRAAPSTGSLAFHGVAGGLAAQDAAPSGVRPSKRVPDKKKERDKRKRDKAKKKKKKGPSPVTAGIAGAAGAAVGATIGLGATGFAAALALGALGPQAPVLAGVTTVMAVAFAIVTPVVAGTTASAGVLLVDKRTKEEDWSSLFSCSTSACCMGVGLVSGGGGGSGGLGTCPKGAESDLPGPSSPIEWTVATTAGGMLGLGALGALAAWQLAPDQDAPMVPIVAGALAGGLVGGAAGGAIGGVTSSLVQR